MDKHGWTYKKLKDVTSKITDGSHNPPKGIDYSEYPMLSSKNIFFDSFNYDSPRYLCKDEFDIENKRTDISDGDVLLTIVGTVGRTCCVQNPFIPFTLQRSVAVLKPQKDVITSRFLMYALHSLSDLWDIEAKGVAQKGIYLKQLATIPIPTPTLAEQERIVAELDLLSSIIEKKKAQLSEYDQLAQSIFYSMFGDLLEANPTNYLKDVASYYIGLTYKPADVSDVGTIVLRSSNIQNNILDFNDIVRVNLNVGENKTVKDGDILMCARNGSARLVGKVARIRNINERMSFGAFMTIIRSDYNDFLFHFFLSDFFRSQLTTSKTATINQITSRMLDNIKLNVPSLSLQQQFAEKIEAIEQQKALVQASIAETETLFNSRMDYYFG